MLTTLAIASTTILGTIGTDRFSDWGPGPGFGIMFLLFPLFFIAIAALVFVLIGRRFRRDGGGPGSHPAFAATTRGAESSLAERFAQGDIDEKEYRARLEVLRANRPDPAQR